MRKYSLNENVFECVDTEYKAYWLGFILADGCVCIRKSGQHVLKITLSTKDKNHLLKFLSFIGSDMPIKKYGSSCEIAISSKKLVLDLINLGITPRKTFTAKIPVIKNNLIRHLIRGIWDGDGSVLFEPRSKKYPNNIIPKLQICGNRHILEAINNIFYEELNLSRSKLSTAGSIYLFRKNTNSAKKVAEFLYKNSSIALDRKYNTALNCINWTSRKAG